MNTQPNNPLHGVTLEQIILRLVDYYGWIGLGNLINIKCFTNDPSVKSSLKFLRKTPWARAQVEQLYIDSLDQPNFQVDLNSTN
ncbi:VF530 family protein [Thiomicrospira sp.]|uniref:VF530 family protein n=1 Tax=Thiomicrospira sp. TaxID=935 RepID=UPI002F92AA64